MRLTLWLMLTLLVFGLVGFVVTNLDARVSVTVWSTPYANVHLFVVVFTALTVGVVFTAIVALVEGASIRLANRRLRREVRRLETESHFLRTQPPSPPRPEPDAIESGRAPGAIDAPPPKQQPPVSGRPPAHPSAPVYVPEDDLPGN